MHFDDTIVALSTGSGGAINIIRLSGSSSLQFVQGYFSKRIERPRYSYFGRFMDGDSVVDEVVVVWYSAPNSYTGEDVIEISCHGSRWVTSEILRLFVLSGARIARAGEYTQRAFLNGKMNLLQAEAVGDLIASGSRSSAQVALNQMRGGYASELMNMREKLLNIKSLLELELDFGDEDVEFASRGDLLGLLISLRDRCRVLASSFSMGNVIKHGVPVAIIGRPNVGKSTLLNALVGEERAIVSNIAGTTRDYIEEVVVIDGVEFRFIDTAGIRHTDDVVEAIGVERSLERMRRAAIVLQLVDSDDFERVSVADGQRLLVVNNKVDLGEVLGCDIGISAKRGEGIYELRERLLSMSGLLGVDLSHETIVTNERHYELLSRVVSSTEASILSVDRGDSGDIISYNLTLALDCLGEITGEYTTDEVLGNIFSNFCIGK